MRRSDLAGVILVSVSRKGIRDPALGPGYTAGTPGGDNVG